MYLAVGATLIGAYYLMLPPGLSFRTRDGRISGTPTLAGTYTVTLTVTDTDTSLSASVTFTWTIQ